MRSFGAFYPLLDFKAFDLARGGPWKIVLPDFVAQDALGGGQFRGKSFDFEAQRVADVDDLVAAKRLEVRDDDAMQTLGERLAGGALEAEHADLLDVRRLLVPCLDFFGVDVLAAAENDDIFLATRDEEVAVRVAVAEVAGQKPSVTKHGGGSVGALVVADHDDAAANRELTDAGSTVLGRGSAVENRHFIAGQRFAN